MTAGLHPGRYVAGAGLCALFAGGYYAREQGLFLPPYERAVLPLVKAVGDRRFFEPRLIGGFKYGPLVSAKRGGGPAPPVDPGGPVTRRAGGPAAEDWAILAAAAKIKEAQAANDSALTKPALAAAHLLMGEVDEAVGLLERAAEENPGDARILSDLAATYLRRAEVLDAVDDRSRALEVASHALEVDASLLEAQFNRALAIESLSLTQQALGAWEAILAIESDSGWRDVAGEHIQRLKDIESVDLAALRQAISAAADAGASAAHLDAAVRAHVGLARDVFERDLLPSLTTRFEAARRLSASFARVTGDPYQEEVLAAGRPDRIERRARDFVEGLKLYDLSRRGDARPYFQRVVRSGSADDPLSLWSRLLEVTAVYDTNLDEARRLLDPLMAVSRQRRFTTLLSRCLWSDGSIRISQNDFEGALRALDEAKTLYEQTQQRDYVSYVEIMRAEALSALGSEARAANARAIALANRHLLKDASRRFSLLIASKQELPPRRLHTMRVFLREAEPLARAEVAQQNPLEWRIESAKVAEEISPGAGLRALAGVEVALDAIEDPAMRGRLSAELAMVRGELAVPGTDEATDELVSVGIAAARARAAFFRLPRLHANRAGVLERLERIDEAERELRSAVRAFEVGLPREGDLSLTALEDAAHLYGQLIDVLVRRGEPPAVTLEVAERFLTLVYQGEPARPGSLSRAIARVPHDAAVITYFQTPAGLNAWVVGRGRCAHHRLPLPREGGSSDVSGAGVARLRRLLVEPLLEELHGVSRVAVVSTPSFARYPFHAMLARGPQKAGLASVHAPSVSAALARAAPRSAGAIVSITDPDTRGRFARLPGTREESRRLLGAAAVATIRFSDAGATRGALLEALPRARFVYVGTHAVASPAAPGRSRLILAGPGNGDLAIDDLRRVRLPFRPVVVLAACDSARGESIGEGELSIAVGFMRVGAAFVLGTTRPLSDTSLASTLLATSRALLADAASAARVLADRLHGTERDEDFNLRLYGSIG